VHPDFRDDEPPRYLWQLRIADEVAAQRVLPLDISPGGAYIDVWRRSLNPDDRVRMGQTSARALREHAPGYRQEFRCRTRDGEDRWLAEEVTLESTGPGRWHAVGICTDVTERKRAEAALREGEHRYRELFLAAERQARELALLDRVRTALADEI